MCPWRRQRPRPPGDNSDGRGRPGRSAELPTRPREISQVSLSHPYSGYLGTSQLRRNPSGRGPQDAGIVRRRQLGESGSVQPSFQSPRPLRPREISQASVYVTPSGHPQRMQGRGPQNRQPAKKLVRQISEPSLYYPYGQRTQMPPGGGQHSTISRPPANQYVDQRRPPGRPREISGVSANMQYYQQQVSQTRIPQGRIPPNLPPRRPPYPYYPQPTIPQSPRYGPNPGYSTDPWGRPVPYPSPYPGPYWPVPVDRSPSPEEEEEEDDEVNESKLPFDYPTATLTGFTELPIGKAFLILLLWLPRFFIPWITAWHEFNVYILSNPWHWKDKEDELVQQKIYLLLGKSTIAILTSVFVDVIRKKCESEYYFYLVLVVLFTLSPVSGGFLDVLLRAQFLDVQLYHDRWFSSFVLTQWAISVAFMMFPVQMACIYSQINTMSRNAHYNWTSLFVLLEFVNAYIVFFIIPGTCPTRDWTQVVVWAGIGLLLVTVTMLTLIFFFVVRVVKFAMMMCCQRNTEDVVEDPEPFIDSSTSLKCKKLSLFMMITLPIVSISFSIGVLERFVPNEDWDNHTFSSALSILQFWKIFGVLLMVMVMIVVRKAYANKNMSSLKTEIIYLGVPQVLCFLALLTMVGRFATLSHMKEGEIIVGPVPNKDKTVLVFVNTMFRNWTVCISSEYFQPVNIRPQKHATRELYGIEVDNFTITMEVDPCFKPAIRTRLQIQNIRKGRWKVYDVALLYLNITELDSWDYYRKLYAYTLRDEGDIRPKVGAPQVVIFQVSALAPIEFWYYQMNHSTLGHQAVKTNNSAWNNLGFARNMILWEVPAIGSWTVKLWSSLYNKSDAGYAWATNCSQCVSPLEFEVENNSLYLLVEYYYEEAVNFALNFSYFETPPSDLQFPMYPLSYVIFKLGEVAGPNSDRLPSNKELQKDWAIKISMALAGMAVGGVFVGLIYLFGLTPQSLGTAPSPSQYVGC